MLFNVGLFLRSLFALEETCTLAQQHRGLQLCVFAEAFMCGKLFQVRETCVRYSGLLMKHGRTCCRHEYIRLHFNEFLRSVLGRELDYLYPVYDGYVDKKYF